LANAATMTAQERATLDMTMFVRLCSAKRI
jgi:hypothetical protein